MEKNGGQREEEEGVRHRWSDADKHTEFSSDRVKKMCLEGS